MLGDLISAVLYATVFDTSFASPTAPVISIMPTATHSILATNEQNKMQVFLNFQHFIEVMENSFGPLFRPHIFMRSPNHWSILRRDPYNLIENLKVDTACSTSSRKRR